MVRLVLLRVSERDKPGESWIFATRSSPRPLRRRTLVVDACASTWPPTGLRPSAPANRALAPGSLWTWFVYRLMWDFVRCKEEVNIPSRHRRWTLRGKISGLVPVKFRKGYWQRQTFGHMCKSHQELVQLLLTVRKFSSSAVIHSEAVHDTVNY